jgi:L-ribulose-5-phosphate 3-epimerase
MNHRSRREFIQTSAGIVAGVLARSVAHATASAPQPEQKIRAQAVDTGKKPLRLGLIIDVTKDPDAALAKVRDLGFPTAQVFVDDFEPGFPQRLRQALDKNNIEATSIVVGGPGKEVWDFYQGPLTIGLVPPETRAARIAHIKKASDVAKQCGISAVQTHCGFIPENPNVQVYKDTVAAIREVATYCKRNGQKFRYETGQETPITLVRAMQDVGTDNQGVNFDLANLILYGKANPVDAIDVLGTYIQGIHAKDGRWPTNPKELGKEVAIGQGKVDFGRIIARLKELDYRGAVTIEREISGPQQVEDVRAAKIYLEKIIGSA